MIATETQTENGPGYDPEKEKQKKEKELHLKSALALQISEVFEHKYYLSEREHHDVGMTRALEDWTSTPIPTPEHTTTQAAEFRRRFEQYWPNIESVCKQECNGECSGRRGCKLPLYRIHELLKD